MKSKNWRPIVLKNPQLRQIRTNLRIVLGLAVKEKTYRLLRLGMIYTEKSYALGLTRSQKRRKKSINKTFGALTSKHDKSILRCSFGVECVTALAPSDKILSSQEKFDMDAYLEAYIDGTATREEVLSVVYSEVLEQDMVWDPIVRGNRHWICINCYNKYFGTPALKRAYKRYIRRPC